MKIVIIDTGIKQSFVQYVDEFYYIEGQEVCKGNKDTENDKIKEYGRKSLSG